MVNKDKILLETTVGQWLVGSTTKGFISISFRGNGIDGCLVLIGIDPHINGSSLYKVTCLGDGFIDLVRPRKATTFISGPGSARGECPQLPAGKLRVLFGLVEIKRCLIQSETGRKDRNFENKNKNQKKSGT